MALAKSKQKPQSMWQKIVDLAKLMRSILLYHYRHDDAVDNANWQRIVITAGIGTVCSAVVTQIILTIFRFYNLGGIVVPKYGYAIILNQTPVPAFRLAVITVDMIFSLLLGFAVIILLSYIIGICLQLWFGESETHHRQEFLGFVQTVIIVKSLYLIPIQIAASTYIEFEFLGSHNSPLRLFTVYTAEWLPNYIVPLILFLSIALPIYGYYVLYRFLRSRQNQVNHFWMRFALIIVITHGLSALMWQQIRVIVTPLYYYVMSVMA